LNVENRLAKRIKRVLQKKICAIRKIPSGVYEAESFLDNDGVDLEKGVPLKIKIVVEEDDR